MPLERRDDVIPIGFPMPIEEWLQRPDAQKPQPRVIGTYGRSYFVTLDGTETELSPSVLYNAAAAEPLSLVHVIAGHLRFMHGGFTPFDGTDDERAVIEDEVRRLLLRDPE